MFHVFRGEILGGIEEQKNLHCIEGKKGSIAMIMMRKSTNVQVIYVSTAQVALASI